MRNSRFLIFLVTVSLGAGIITLLLMQDGLAEKFPLPDIKGQVKKEDVKTSGPMELQADQVSFNSTDNKATAQGNVVLVSQGQELNCDSLQLDRAIQQAVAQGHVYLDTPQEQVITQQLIYNFNAHTGEFRDARVYADPYQLGGKTIDKVSETHTIMNDGFMTTCDLDEPHYRMAARRIDVYQKDKAIARGVKIYLGKVPVMYLPYYAQDLRNRPILTFVPGEKKDFGLFLLSTLRIPVGSHVKLALHLDARERVGFGEGVDVKYDTPNFGSGILSVYYTNENRIASNHLWDMYRNGIKKGPTDHHTRYRVRWRHRWEIDKNTDAVMQVYKIHDYDIVNSGFLKQYFTREYNEDADVNTYFVLTHVMPHGTLTFDVNYSRINPRIQTVDRYPEINYTLNNQQIGNTGFYVKSSDTYSNLTYQDHDPQTFNEKTQRFDSNNDISHPFKIGFVEFNPHAGGEETYYSRTAYLEQRNIVRGLFRTSLDVGTKFYRIWNDYKTNFLGMDINGLRHSITPTITYLYQARPTVPASNLNQFDPIDNLYRINQLEYGLENKLQTKRDGKLVDLLRVLITANYGLKTTTGHRGLDPVDLLTDFNPNSWLTFHEETVYDLHAGHFNSEDLSATVHSGNWSFGLGNDFTRGGGDQLTTEFKYTINPKWKFRIYNSFPLSTTGGEGFYDVTGTNGISSLTGALPNSARLNEYVLTRDMHEWEMDLGIDQQEGQGSTFYVLFRLKAFPDMKLDMLQSNFAPSRPGAQ